MTTDPHDALMDARSESRYEEDPRSEPDTREVAEGWMRDPDHFACIADESEGFRG